VFERNAVNALYCIAFDISLTHCHALLSLPPETWLFLFPGSVGIALHAFSVFSVAVLLGLPLWVDDKLTVALAPLVVALFCSSFMRMSRFGLAAR